MSRTCILLRLNYSIHPFIVEHSKCPTFILSTESNSDMSRIVRSHPIGMHGLFTTTSQHIIALDCPPRMSASILGRRGIWILWIHFHRNKKLSFCIQNIFVRCHHNNTSQSHADSSHFAPFKQLASTRAMQRENL